MGARQGGPLEGRLVVGVDIGNSTTEACLAVVAPDGSITYLGTDLTRTTGVKGTPDNTEGALKAIRGALARAGRSAVEVGTVLVVDRQKAGEDGTLSFAPVLLVDGETVTHAAEDLAKVNVTAEFVQDERGPKIVIQKFKNKTGYKKRQGHRQELTKVKITGIK